MGQDRMTLEAYIRLLATLSDANLLVDVERVGDSILLPSPPIVGALSRSLELSGSVAPGTGLAVAQGHRYRILGARYAGDATVGNRVVCFGIEEGGVVTMVGPATGNIAASQVCPVEVHPNVIADFGQNIRVYGVLASMALPAGDRVVIGYEDIRV